MSPAERMSRHELDAEEWLEEHLAKQRWFVPDDKGWLIALLLVAALILLAIAPWDRAADPPGGYEPTCVWGPSGQVCS